MAYNDSRAVANWFIRRAARERGRALSNMQLQKLVYFAHGWNLALNNEPLIRDDVQAWDFGPVIPNLYSSLARWGAQPIPPDVQLPIEEFSPSDEEVMEQVYQAYGHLPAVTLSALTHRPGTPWTNVYEPGRRGILIGNTVIADHFSELATRLTD